MSKRPVAHIARDTQDNWRPPHDLAQHLSGVAEQAAEFARLFGAADWAKLAGLWHDLGKYRPAFQSYIRKHTGFEREDAHIEGEGVRVEHSSAGALHAIQTLGEPQGRLLAYLIAGHHSGLPDGDGSPSALFQRLSKAQREGHLQEVLSTTPPDDILNLESLKPRSRPQGGPADLHLWLRMLFSCLVDADFLDTESYMEPDKASARGVFPGIDQLLDRLEVYLKHLRTNALPTAVNRLRERVLTQCIERAKGERGSGLFSLTVPTGGGKTLASLAFALHHARIHEKRRVIYVIPYLSIIEQTVEVFCEVFGPEVVVEHHSHLDPTKETLRSRVAAENWDAPLIVTTNVQFFESLYAANPARCRKLHNLVESVVILDEAHLLPPEWVEPCLRAIRCLAAYYGVTFVLCTATQPAFRPREVDSRSFPGLPGIEELMQGGPHVQSPQELYSAMQRVCVHWPTTLEPEDWEKIAQRIAAHPQALVIVNRKSHARILAEHLPESLYLSTNLCGAHRSERIQEIRQKLCTNRESLQRGSSISPLRVVSTQLIEAGVDVDFPVVFRALSGLDAIAQAAGRCNREGFLECGDVYVFVPPQQSPPGLLRKSEQVTREFLALYPQPDLSPEIFERFSRLLLSLVNTWDKASLYRLLMPSDRLQIQFRQAAERFRLIDETAFPIIVRWGESTELIAQLKSGKTDRWLFRQLQRYTVNVHLDCLKQLHAQHEVYEVLPGLYIQENDSLYDEKFGFLGCAYDQRSYEPQDLIV